MGFVVPIVEYRPERSKEGFDLEKFEFRGLHSKILIGTASDRYSGWIGQVYSPDLYTNKISRRTNQVGGKSFIEEVLPVKSVEEYFGHFRVLEIDFTFYRLLLDQDGKPTQNFQILKSHRSHAKSGDCFVLKVPQTIFAQKVRREGGYVDNEAYLDPETFTRQFYDPAVKLLGPNLNGFVFEQEYQRAKERKSLKEMALALDAFFSLIPKDKRYRYEEAYALAHPFDKMVKGMLSPETVKDTVVLMHAGIDQGISVNMIINNRAGGNAPMIAQLAAEGFLSKGHTQ